MERKQLNFLIFFPAAIVYLELITKLLCFGSLSVTGAILTLLFSLAAGALLGAICSLFGRKAVPALLVSSFLLCLLFAAQNVYHHIFRVFFSLSSVAQAGDVFTEFRSLALQGITGAWKTIMVMFLPFIAAVLLRKQFEMHRSGRILIACMLLHLGALCCVYIQGDGVMSPRYLYTGGYMPELSVRNFGVLTTTRLDVRQLMSPAEAAAPVPTPEPVPEPSVTPVPTAVPEPYKPNVLDIDFSALAENESNDTLRKMHEHFASVEPTYKNEYTGYFQDKNLIWIVAEGFSDMAVDEKHTPTLYKLLNSGFVFKNFYNPVWGVSTSDGEYVTLTGLLPKSGVWSFTKSADRDMSMTMGHMLSGLGYSCRAYHDHTYTYYNRHLSHPNLGYDYKAIGNGLEMENVWPRSDREMAEKTAGEFIDDEKFHTYYLTVSGHQYYTFSGNMQAWRHRDDVADLPYSSNCRAYVACNMELDLMAEHLITELEKAGKLDDTVIVLSGDHYPYGLTHQEIEELRGHEVDGNFELYRSGLIIWNSDMDKIEIEKPCSSVDVFPTLANLFGLDYDSRLLAGRDILSDSEGLVLFANRSFISEYGRYDSVRDKFIPNEGAVVPKDHARDTLYGRVNDAFNYSSAILDNDYYSVVLTGDADKTVN